jgi:hypothetical protein
MLPNKWQLSNGHFDHFRAALTARWNELIVAEQSPPLKV